jgi:exportin-7
LDLHTCRLESVRAVLEGGGGGEDPLDNDEQLGDQLDALPFLCRFQYDATSAYLLALMDPVLVAYQAAAAGGTACSPQLSCI